MNDMMGWWMARGGTRLWMLRCMSGGLHDCMDDWYAAIIPNRSLCFAMAPSASLYYPQWPPSFPHIAPRCLSLALAASRSLHELEQADSLNVKLVLRQCAAMGNVVVIPCSKLAPPNHLMPELLSSMLVQVRKGKLLLPRVRCSRDPPALRKAATLPFSSSSSPASSSSPSSPSSSSASSPSLLSGQSPGHASTVYRPTVSTVYRTHQQIMAAYEELFGAYLTCDIQVVGGTRRQYSRYLLSLFL